MVSPYRGFSVAPSGTNLRSIYYPVQQQNASFCVTSVRSPCLGSRCTQPVLGGSGPICLSTSGHIWQNGGKVTRLSMQEYHSDCSRVALHALVLGSSDHVKSDSSMPAQHAQSTNTTFQPDSSQESVKPKSTWLSPL